MMEKQIMHEYEGLYDVDASRKQNSRNTSYYANRASPYREIAVTNNTEIKYRIINVH